MSRFAALMSSGSDEEEAENPLQMLTPQYRIKDILGQFKPSTIPNPPKELTQFDSLYSKDIISPECNTFKPPTSEINAPAFTQQNIPGKRGITQISPQKRNTKSSQPRQKQKPTEYGNSQEKTTSVTQLTEEELASSWFYKDPTDYVLGPYPASVMRLWYDKRYISQNLLVCQGNKNGVFKPISAIFTDSSHAFEKPPPEHKTPTIEIQKPIHVETHSKPEKRLSTLFSFSVDEKESNLLECWEKSELTDYK